MNLLVLKGFEFGGQWFERGQSVNVNGDGIAMALVYGNKAVAADPAAAAALRALGVESSLGSASVTTSSTTSADEVLRELRRKRLTTPAMSTKVWVR